MLGRLILPLLALAAAPALAGELGHEHHAHGAHQHGVAQLEVAVDGPTLTIRLESPLDNLLGFEHAPRTEKQKQAAQGLLAALRRGDGLFTPTATAGCKLNEAKVEAPVLEGRADAGDHADLDADWRYTCAQPARLTGMKVGLFAKYPGLKRLDAAVVSGKGQAAFRLTRKQPFLSW
ncbi:MAG TPA: DUF2796 domain-containing protein [Thiobacillaceae bacterium]|nr:DUF2796 domain-containing protein [Thiobacillaceae bacterium]